LREPFKLFDEAGERLTPSQVVKGNRRYRYYVSRSLMKSSTGQKARGRRIPALEIEHKLAAALSKILDDGAAIVHDMDRNLDPAKVKSTLESVARWSARLLMEEERSNALASLIERADLSRNGIRVSLRVPLEESSQSSGAASTFLLIKRQVPIEVRRRGSEMRLVIGGGADAKIDSAILKVVARSNQWLTQLLSGRSELAG
jgi:hypothetical protein